MTQKYEELDDIKIHYLRDIEKTLNDAQLFTLKSQLSKIDERCDVANIELRRIRDLLSSIQSSLLIIIGIMGCVWVYPLIKQYLPW